MRLPRSLRSLAMTFLVSTRAIPPRNDININKHIKTIMWNLILITLLVLIVILVVWVIKHHHKSNKQTIIAAPVEVTKVIRKDV